MEDSLLEQSLPPIKTSRNKSFFGKKTIYKKEDNKMKSNFYNNV